MSADEVKKRLAATGRLLLRSRTEIAKLLDAMCAEGDAITTSIESGETLFLSRLLRAESEREFIVIACSPEKRANSKLLAERLVTLRCNHRGVHYEFSAGHPREARHGTELAIQLTFPVAVVALERRSHTRTAVPPSVPLRCDLPLGPASLSASVVDLTVEGIGSIVYDATVGIEPGTRIRSALIRHPRRPAIKADLEVRYVARVVGPDGRAANRAGCKILTGAHELEELLRLFITELE